MIKKRKIKLRVFHADYKNWYVWDADDASDDNCHNLAYRKQGTEIQQFTGIPDKNGNEIWEGDIVFICDEKHIVYYNNLYCHGWFLKSIKQHYNIDLTNKMIDEIEVIGNIYTHPELLEKM